MIPGPTLILQCPECGNLLKRHTLASGNTFGARHYSDNKVEAPHLPALPVLSKCSRCDTIFWLEKLEEIGSYSYGETKNEEWEAAENAITLDIDEMFRALDHDGVVADKDDELFIRHGIWLAYNDRSRKGRKLHESAEDESKWRDNILRLLDLIGAETDNGRIYHAELNRNLGNFVECARILDSIRSPELRRVRNAIREECQKQNTLVFEFQE